jgi:hypothetical protein
VEKTGFMALKPVARNEALIGHVPSLGREQDASDDKDSNDWLVFIEK